jgi:hypothetical protein
MSAFSISLRALCHPSTILCLAVLLLNDHVLKVLTPNAFTGKLSDFAGLFFFPFLLTAFLSLPLERLRLSPHKVAVLAFGSTAIWFSLIKTTFWANTLMVAGIKSLFDLPIQIIRDPSDLIALMVLWPSWLHWRRIERSSYHHPPGKAAYAILGLASLATIATSCPQPTRITRLVPYQGVVYSSWYGYVEMSEDGGQHWKSADTETLPSEILDSLDQHAELPVVDCTPENNQLCYRVAGEEVVEGSDDGGKTWHVVWSVPPGRRKFMEHLNNVSLCKETPILGPFDMVVLGYGDSHSVVVAMGNQGVLIRSREGDWERIEVLDAEPTPFRVQSLTEVPPVLHIEISTILMISILILIGFNTWGLTQILEMQRAWPTLVLGGFILLPTAFSIYQLLTSTLFYPTVPFALSLLLAVIWIVISLVRKPDEERKLGRTSLRIAIESFILGLLPLVLWTFGVIPWYELALVISACLEILIILVGFRRTVSVLHTDEA